MASYTDNLHNSGLKWDYWQSCVVRVCAASKTSGKAASRTDHRRVGNRLCVCKVLHPFLVQVRTLCPLSRTMTCVHMCSAIHYRSDSQTPLETVLELFDYLFPCEQVDDHVLARATRATERRQLQGWRAASLETAHGA